MKASNLLCVAMRNNDFDLVQEASKYKEETKGLKEVGAELIYSRSTEHLRICILAINHFLVLQLM
jgi:hypothetical protein